MREPLKTILLLMVGAIVSASLTESAALADDCGCDSVLAGGVFNKTALESNGELQQSSIDFLLSKSYEEVKRAMDAGFHIVIKVPFGANFSKEDFQKWQMENQHLKKYDFDHRYNYRIVTQNASKDILDVWVKCKSECSPQGLRGVAQTGASDEKIAFLVSWIPAPGDRQAPVVKQFSVLGAKINPETMLRGGDEILIGINTNVVALVRESVETDVLIVLKTTKGDVRCFVPPAHARCEKCSGSGNVACAKCGSKGYVRKEPSFVLERCPDCKGAKLVECPNCKGTGKR